VIRVTKKDYDEATCLPSELVGEMAEASALAHQVWAKARANNDFKAFAPSLERIMDLMRREAEAFGYEEHPHAL
jgi:carboxypeptidase Taq